MTSNDRGRVKTHRADAPSNIDLSERSVFDYFSLRKGKRTPETETALRFYTASATTGRSASSSKTVITGDVPEPASHGFSAGRPRLAVLIATVADRSKAAPSKPRRIFSQTGDDHILWAAFERLRGFDARCWGGE